MRFEDLEFEVLKLLERKPSMSQRELARALGISVGKTNHALRALLERGWLKMQQFRNARNRTAYVYKLTPSGVTEKAKMALLLLQKKRVEHEALMEEIQRLRREVGEAFLDQEN